MNRSVCHYVDIALPMKTVLKPTSDKKDSSLTTFKCAMDKAVLTDTLKEQRHCPLTLFRLVRGMLCILILFSTPFMIVTLVTPFTSIVLRLFSIHYSRRATAFLFNLWLAMWPLLFEYINGTKVVFSGDNIPARERVLLISNHRTEVDWMYVWSLAIRKNCLGFIKYVLKSSVRNVPIFGWGFYILEFILIDRKWETDKPVFESMLTTFKDRHDPLWLVLYPEGTDFTEAKRVRSQQYAKKHGFPVLNNVLLPRTKGFFTCLAILRDSLDAVYDVTIGYKHRCPGFMDNVFGLDPAEVHINVRRIPVDQMPTSEDKVQTWLFQAYQRKDDLLSTFCKEGHFTSSLAMQKVPTTKSLLNSLLMICATVMFFIYLFKCSWLRLYVTLSCTYFAAATYSNFRPSPIARK